MSGEWQGIVTATAKTYLKGAADNTVRDRLLLMWMQKYGRIKFNQKGFDFTWDVQFSQHPMQSYGDMGTVTHERRDLYKQITGDVRGYIMTDLMSEKEYSMCAGASQAIVDRYARTLPTMISTFSDKFAGEFFTDGFASGNQDRLCGFNSFTGTSTTASGDWLAKPSDAYFNLNTDLGSYGGSWTANQATSPNASVATDWPYGSGDTEYDFNTPKLINWKSTAWTGSTGTFATTGYLAIRRGLSTCTHTGGRNGRPGIVLLGRDLFDSFKASQDSKLNIWVPHKEAQDLGFADTLNFEGAVVTADYDVPATEGYGININEMELLITKDDLFFSYGPDRDPKSLSYLFTAGVFGNLRFNPKFFFKLNDYA